jgi:hypothetical protein
MTASRDKIPATKKGWMTKQGRGGLVKNWKKRYFVLTAGKIQYYVNETKEYPYGDVLKVRLNRATNMVTSFTYKLSYFRVR